ncbi:MAG: sarcosine oxidase subunit delta [Pseudomonadota bacterium]
MRITCPLCGERDYGEFSIYGDASRQRPHNDNTDPETWYEYVFLRTNPKGRHQEYWQHIQGCRQWLVVDRDTVTHEVYNVSLARDLVTLPDAPKEAKGGKE